jgi:hypothetical protein
MMAFLAAFAHLRLVPENDYLLAPLFSLRDCDDFGSLNRGGANGNVIGIADKQDSSKVDALAFR